MLRKANELLGLPIVTRDGGEKIGELVDVVLDRDAGQALGLLVDEAGWFKDAHAVSWTSVLVIGPDVIIVDSKQSVQKASEIPEMKEVLDRGYVLHGVRVQTTDGHDLGRLEAVVFDTQSGKVDGFELSDQPGGHPTLVYLPRPQSFESGRDVAFVPPEALHTLRDPDRAT